MTTTDRAIRILKYRKRCIMCVADCNCDECDSAFDMAIKALEQGDVLDKIRAEIEQKIEQERFARSVFRGEEKDAVKAEHCTGSIFAYNNVIKLIDKHRAESEDKE